MSKKLVTLDTDRTVLALRFESHFPGGDNMRIAFSAFADGTSSTSTLEPGGGRELESPVLVVEDPDFSWLQGIASRLREKDNPSAYLVTVTEPGKSSIPVALRGIRFLAESRRFDYGPLKSFKIKGSSASSMFGAEISYPGEALPDLTIALPSPVYKATRSFLERMELGATVPPPHSQEYINTMLSMHEI
jgi:hypothetical protein